MSLLPPPQPSIPISLPLLSLFIILQKVDDVVMLGTKTTHVAQVRLGRVKIYQRAHRGLILDMNIEVWGNFGMGEFWEAANWR